MTDRPTTRILTADDRGVPLTASCPCGWTWTRPADDVWADTLSTDARAHRPCDRRPTMTPRGSVRTMTDTPPPVEPDPVDPDGADPDDAADDDGA